MPLNKTFETTCAYKLRVKYIYEKCHPNWTHTFFSVTVQILEKKTNKNGKLTTFNQ